VARRRRPLCARNGNLGGVDGRVKAAFYAPAAPPFRAIRGADAVDDGRARFFRCRRPPVGAAVSAAVSAADAKHHHLRRAAEAGGMSPGVRGTPRRTRRWQRGPPPHQTVGTGAWAMGRAAPAVARRPAARAAAACRVSGRRASAAAPPPSAAAIVTRRSRSKPPPRPAPAAARVALQRGAWRRPRRSRHRSARAAADVAFTLLVTLSVGGSDNPIPAKQTSCIFIKIFRNCS